MMCSIFAVDKLKSLNYVNCIFCFSGSGKTGAFCLPVLQIVYETMYCKYEYDLTDNYLKVGENLRISLSLHTLGESKRKNTNPDQSNEVKLSLHDRAPAVMLNNDQLSCQSKSGTWAGVRANKGVTRNAKEVNKNKFYFEIHFAEAGLARVGWSLANASLDLGTDRGGFGYGGTAKKSNNRQFDSYGEEFGTRNDLVGACLDLDNGDISFTKNNRMLGVAFSLGKNLMNEGIFMPTICTKNAQCSARFVSDPNSKTRPPPGYRWIGECVSLSTQIVPNPNVDRSSNSSSSTGKQQNTNSGPKAIIIEPSRELGK